MTEIMDDAKRHELACPPVPPELLKVFKDAKDFFTSHSDKYAHLLVLEKTEESVTHSAHAEQKLPTADNGAVHVPTSSARKLSKRRGRCRKKEQIQLEIGVSPSSNFATRKAKACLTAHAMRVPHQVSLHEGRNPTRIWGDGGGCSVL